MTPACFRVYRAYRSVYLFFVLSSFLVLLSAGPAHALDRESEAYLRTLVVAAQQKNLYADRYWNILLHYKPSGSGMTSLVDDPKFFLSPEGKTNPQAELKATLAAFFQDPALGDDHPQCRFVARYAWLKKQLHIDESKLPSVTCAKYREALGNIRMQSAVLVFPAAYGNGPASMFGHTLIRIDSTLKSDLLSYAVNYAAHAEDSNGFIYTFKGLFGFYKGYYSILPYYEKVKEYNNIEHRDIWEYHLNLSEPEVRRMVMHIWELKDTYSDYYFFTENCSYNLLFLLEAARPTVNLTDPFRERIRFWVIPSDTIRAVVASGMVDGVKYRPSLATRVESLAAGMSADDQKLTVKIMRRDIAPVQLTGMKIPAEEKAKVLDLTAELLQYRYSNRELPKEEYLKQFMSVLNSRSTITGQSVDVADTVSLPGRPDLGHRPGKVAMSAGWHSSRRSAWFSELEWRPAYHDLMDPGEGYVDGAQVNFLDIRGRYYPDDGTLKLQSWRLLDIISLAPRDRFFLPVSWKVAAGFDRLVMKNGSEHLAFRVNSGGGAAYKMGTFGMAYLMLESDIQLSNAYYENFSFGLGPSAGVYADLTRLWRVNLSGQAIFYRLGEKHQTLKGTLRQSFMVNVNNTMELTASREETFHHDLTDIMLGWNFYF